MKLKFTLLKPPNLCIILKSLCKFKSLLLTEGALLMGVPINKTFVSDAEKEYH